MASKQDEKPSRHIILLFAIRMNFDYNNMSKYCYEYGARQLKSAFDPIFSQYSGMIYDQKLSWNFKNMFLYRVRNHHFLKQFFKTSNTIYFVHILLGNSKLLIRTLF